MFLPPHSAYEGSGVGVCTTLTRRPQSRMAAVAELSFLLFALINNIHGEELTIQKEMESYTFNLPKEAKFCLISRFIGEEKLVLWNTSDLWSKNSTVPEDLKQRLSIVSRDNISSYMIHNLTHSDSGLYQEECWTEGEAPYKKNISFTICSTIDGITTIPVNLGGTEDLSCYGAADNLDILWLERETGYEQQDIWKRMSRPTRWEVDDIKGRFKVVKNTSDLHQSHFTASVLTLYVCLVMNQQQCVSSHPVQLILRSEIIYHSVEETAVLLCTLTNFSDDQPPLWMKPDVSGSVTELGRNYSLVFSLLTLDHSGVYSCGTDKSMQVFDLLVCPKFGPPAVEFFSEGDNVTLTCGHSHGGPGNFWFIKSNQTGGKIFSEMNVGFDPSMSRVKFGPDGKLFISNVSVEDMGEYWCAVTYSHFQCVSTTKTLLKYREPFGIHSTFYTVRSWLLSGLLVLLCVCVVAVNHRTRRAEQLPAETEG